MRANVLCCHIEIFSVSMLTYMLPVCWHWYLNCSLQRNVSGVPEFHCAGEFRYKHSMKNNVYICVFLFWCHIIVIIIDMFNVA